MRVPYLLFLLLFSCGTVQKMGLRTVAPLFKNAGDLNSRERDWNFFRASAPANLKMAELLYLQNLDNKTYLHALVKGYAGYAFGVSETLMLNDELSGADSSENRREAIIMYTRSLDYGFDYLEKQGIKRNEVLTFSEDDLLKKFDRELSEDDYSVVIYTAQAWASLINLQKDNMNLVSHIPKVKTFFDWVCRKDPKIELGVCSIFFAQYEGSRPKMLGGNPEKGRILYEEAMAKHPKNLLIRMGYIQNMLLPAFDKELYEKEAKILTEEFAKWEDLNRDDLQNHSLYRVKEDYNLFNAIAKKRFEIIEKNKSKIF
jgi:hypothetical protein